MKNCVNCPGAIDHDTAHCPLRVIRLGELNPEQRRALARGHRPEQAEGAQGEREEFATWWNHPAQWELRKSCAMGWGEKVWRAARAALAQPSPKCATCDDNGRIGGPSFYAPDEGGDPCPDCAQRSPVNTVLIDRGALNDEAAAPRARVVLVPGRIPSNGQKEEWYLTGWNACLDELARLNGKAVSEGLLRRLSDLFPADMGDDGSGRAGWLPHVRETVAELRALIGEGNDA